MHVHIHDEPDGLTPRVTALETQMGVVDERILALNAKVEEYNQDVQAKIEALRAEVEANNPTPAELAALATLEATVSAGVDLVGDGDGDGNPATPVPPVDPEV